MITTAGIAGEVQYRQVDGANVTIRVGPCPVEEAARDAAMGPVDGVHAAWRPVSTGARAAAPASG